MRYTTLISTDILACHISDPAWVVIDCRFALADPAAGGMLHADRHIPGAHYAHLDRHLSARITDTSGRHPLPDPEQLCLRLGEWGITPQSQVVAYDDAGGVFAARLWWLLRWLGHEAVAVLDGGWSRWCEEGGMQQKPVPVTLPGNYPGQPDNRLWLTATQLQDELIKAEIVLIDARAPERFRGEVEPIDPVAGHIPGAVNYPFQNNLNSRGLFKPADHLRRAFEPLLQGRPPQQVVHMCGSGVTACHNLLAMEIAGLSGSRLYAGSWSEWIRDRERGVATGD
jgi:thiosulfate/3-mercaptopyruvate sulfurtransferase